MNEAREDARKLVMEASGEAVSIDEVKTSQMADVSCIIAFKLARKRRKSPASIAQEIAAAITPRGLIGGVTATDGYINFSLDYGKFTKHVLGNIAVAEGTYGKPLVSPEGKIVLEHTSVNPSGPIHIGRLRNSIIGDSLRRILSFVGYDVETRYFVNDIGKQMAIIALGFKEGIKPDENLAERYARFKGKEDFQVFFEYVAANKVFESDAGFKERVQTLIRTAELGNQDALKAITSVAKRCLEGQKSVYSRLGITFDAFDFESSLIENRKAFDVVSRLEKEKLWKTTDVGSGLDLSGYGIEKGGGITVLKRLDGTSVYLARDLAYHLEKKGYGDRLINVLGEDHKVQALELATILKEFLNFKKPLDVVHYSFVSFEGSRLSTRRGEIASVDELVEEALEKAKAEVDKRGIAGIETAAMIGIGAIKYHLVKTTPSKPITFRWEDALSFEGEAAPYIQYVHARSCRILEKAGIDVQEIDVDGIDTSLEVMEQQLVKELSLFPDAVEEAARSLKPHIIANYVYSLSATYNKFYLNCPVLTETDSVRNRRLLMVYAVAQVVKTGLDLLGIEAPQRM
jgi:arginyl-tRNA synthetase